MHTCVVLDAASLIQCTQRNYCYSFKNYFWSFSNRLLNTKYNNKCICNDIKKSTYSPRCKQHFTSNGGDGPLSAALDARSGH